MRRKATGCSGRFPSLFPLSLPLERVGVCAVYGKGGLGGVPFRALVDFPGITGTVLEYGSLGTYSETARGRKEGRQSEKTKRSGTLP